MTAATPMRISPLGRVEGDLDLKLEITDGVVSDAWTEASMFRGFEIILKGKDPQAGLIVTPRICGICGGSHLYKACYALDTAWETHVPRNATLIRNIAQCCETLQSIPRWFYALFAIDLTNKNYADLPEYEEVVERNRERMKQAKGKMRERSGLVEHPFGTLKCRAGWTDSWNIAASAAKNRRKRDCLCLSGAG